MARILVVDDERSIRNTLKDILEFESHQVTLAEDGMSALSILKEHEFDLLFSDIKMPQMDGIELLDQVRISKPELPVIMISGHGTIEVAVDAIKRGAYDFIIKPIDLNRLMVAVRNALDKKELVVTTNILKKRVERSYQMVGQSDKIKQVRDMIDKVAATDARVLITGPNGSGKEVVARQIFALSQRASFPFIEVNCAAIPSELIESELFGHEKGAFTSAVSKRQGKFEQANGGTLFLDEIGDMSLSAQAKVLRTLQENTVTPVGSDRSIKVNVRVLAATNKNLAKEIESGNFREDLFHRLNVIPIYVPALSERSEDIPLLVDHFTRMICQEQGVALKSFTNEAIEELKSRQWRGNIRELRNVIERLIILCSDTVTLSDVNAFA